MICNRYKQFFSTLADPTQLSIIKLLRKGPRTVSDICEQLQYEQSRISHNLKKLLKYGFVTMTPKGRQRIYEIDKKTILPLLKLIDKHVETY